MNVMSLDPRIEAIRKEYGLDKDDFWQIPQNKQWVAKHAALEVVATKAGVQFSMPTIIEADTDKGIAVLAVSGTLGNRSDWSTGEASSKNCKNAYPWAMAEKRAKDRLVLKLVGIHGLVYSEEEDDDFARPTTKSSARLKRNGAWEEIMSGLDADLVDVQTTAALEHLRNQYLDKAEKDGWTAAWKAALVDRFEGCEADIRKNNLWAEMTSVTTLGGLQSFWEDNSTLIKALGSKALEDFTAEKEKRKRAFLAKQSTLAAG
jgi:hypothetical protein